MSGPLIFIMTFVAMGWAIKHKCAGFFLTIVFLCVAARMAYIYTFPYDDFAVGPGTPEIMDGSRMSADDYAIKYPTESAPSIEYDTR